MTSDQLQHGHPQYPVQQKVLPQVNLLKAQHKEHSLQIGVVESWQVGAPQTEVLVFLISLAGSFLFLSLRHRDFLTLVFVHW